MLSLTTLNADVLEVIAEYACDTVSDACALRGSCKGYRRAVDTTVRRLVYEDQPELRTSRDVTLRVHRNSDHLDAVRIAFTCDGFPVIARLVVVAFGLERAKDELHEGEECGPRPVACSDSGQALDVEVSESCWVGPLQLAVATASAPVAVATSPTTIIMNGRPAQPPPSAVAVVRCLSDVFVTPAALLTSDADADADAGTAVQEVCDGPLTDVWAGVSRLAFRGELDERRPPPPEASRRLARMLSALGPHRLRCLWLDGMTEGLCSAIARCDHLTHFRMRQRPSRALSQKLCDALIASGAPLERVSADCCPRAGLRLLEAVPSIVKATIPRLDAEDLPAEVAQRLVFFNYTESATQFPRAERVTFDSPSDWESPAAHATSVNVTDNAGLFHHGADIAALLPKLERLSISGIAASGVARLPPTLRELNLLDADSGDASRDALRLIAALGPSALPRLASLSLGSGVRDPIAPLEAFAATLTSISFDIGHRPLHDDAGDAAAVVVAGIEATLSRLVQLTDAQVAGLPSTRCFASGAHRRLKELVVDCDLNPPTIPFARLVRACPRLLLVQGTGSSTSVGFGAVPGWSVRAEEAEGSVVAQRVSFC